MWYKNAGTTFFRFVTTRLTDGQTDGQTDRILITRPRLHTCSAVKTWRFRRFHICINRQEYRNDDVTYTFPCVWLQNKTLELVYENAPECTILKWIKIFWAGGHKPLPRLPRLGGGHPLPTPFPLGARRFSRLQLSTPHCFLTNRTLVLI